MKKTIIFLFIFILLFQIVNADVEILLKADKISYQQGEDIEVSVYLAPTSTPEFFFDSSIYITSQNQNIKFDKKSLKPFTNALYKNLHNSEQVQDKNEWWMFATSPATLLTLKEARPLGAFTVKVTKEVTTSEKIIFNVDTQKSSVVNYNDNFEEVPLKLTSKPLEITLAPGVITPTPSKGKSGGSCTPKWSCADTWGSCDANLEQTRVCVDLNECQEQKVETQKCSSCEESWICSYWGACKDGKEQRNCLDENYCKSKNTKPLLEKTCGASESGFPPNRVDGEIEFDPSKDTSSKDSESSLIYIIIGIVILIGGGIAAYFLLRKPRLSYHHRELHKWINDERRMGTSFENIKQIMAENTGWSHEQLEEAFEQLRKEEQKINYIPTGNIPSNLVGHPNNSLPQQSNQPQHY